MDDEGMDGPRRGRHAPEEPAAAPLPPPGDDATVWTDRVPPSRCTADEEGTDVHSWSLPETTTTSTPTGTSNGTGTTTPDDDGTRTRPPRRGPHPRRPRPHARPGVGQLLVTAGLVVLLFVVYEVWITDLTSDRKQDALSDELRQDWQGDDPTVPGLPSGGISEVPLGQGFAFIRIPRFGADYVKVILEGTDEDELVEGPATTSTPPCPVSRATSPSRATASARAHRSWTSTSCSPATRS